jgi:hypothetical protein
MKFSTPLDRRSEIVHVLTIVISELEFGDIERHIFAAHFVERADHAALEYRPKALNGLSVDCTDDILPFGMINDAMRIFAVEPLVTWPLIGAKQTDFVGDSFADKRRESVRSDIRDHAGDDIALAADSADDWCFAEPMPPVPPPPRLSQCLFLAKPPTKVSSTSTMPPSLSMSCMRAVRTLWHMSHAVL